MKVSALWFGGVGYSPPEQDDVEYFDSIQAAEDCLLSRLNNDDFSTPCVEENTEMWLVKGIVDYIECPDYVIYIGPRGGIHREKG